MGTRTHNIWSTVNRRDTIWRPAQSILSKIQTYLKSNSKRNKFFVSNSWKSHSPWNHRFPVYCIFGVSTGERTRRKQPLLNTDYNTTSLYHRMIILVFMNLRLSWLRTLGNPSIHMVLSSILNNRIRIRGRSVRSLDPIRYTLYGKRKWSIWTERKDAQSNLSSAEFKMMRWFRFLMTMIFFYSFFTGCSI